MKRFTETEKWRDVWFMDLPIKFKLAWLYMCDQCDVAGIFEPNTRLMECQIGEPINGVELLRQMGGRVEALKSGKWRIVGFVRFQYGRELNPKNNAHLGVIRALQRAGITDVESIFSSDERDNDSGAAKPLTSPSLGAQDKDKDKDKDKVEEVQEEKETHASRIYSAYPLKVGKQAALKAIGNAIKAGKSPEALLEATRAYAAAVAKWPSDARSYVPHPATWFNRGSYDDDRQTWVKSGSTSARRPISNESLFDLPPDCQAALRAAGEMD